MFLLFVLFVKIIKSICVRHNLLIFLSILIKDYPSIGISYYNTSGANETILVKFNCLNSRAIAPKTRVPFGFPS